ncbi:hypothetical protein EV1_021110 [Malus domestica]
MNRFELVGADPVPLEPIRLDHRQMEHSSTPISNNLQSLHIYHLRPRQHSDGVHTAAADPVTARPIEPDIQWRSKAASSTSRTESRLRSRRTVRNVPGKDASRALAKMTKNDEDMTASLDGLTASRLKAHLQASRRKVRW